MDKIHYQTDQEDLFRLCDGQMFTLYDDNVKSAASDFFTKEKLREHAPDKDHFMLHVIAMGDQETYGPNKNGDGFPKEALEKFHNTFVSDGCFFREHRNRCQETQGIGHIKASAFNSKMRRVELVVHGNKKKAEKEYEMAKAGKALSFSMSCFPPGTLVQMADGTELPIEDVKVGYSVISHKGNIRTVTHIMSRAYADSAITLHASGLPESITATADHGIWVRPKLRGDSPCPVCGSVYKNLKAHLWQKKDTQHAYAYKNYSLYAEGFKRADSILPGDYVRTALPKYAQTKCEHPAYPKLLGYYLAEGSLSVINKFYTKQDNTVSTYLDHRIEFTFNINEKSFIEETQDLVAQITGKRPAAFEYPANSRTVVRSHDIKLFEWLETHGSKFSHSKKVSAHVMGWRDNELQQVLEGWLEGDGTWNKNNEILSGTTVSRSLMWQMTYIAAKLGLTANISGYTSKLDNKKRAYVLQIAPCEGIKNLNISKIPSDWEPVAPSFRPVGHLKHQNEGQLSKLAFKVSKPQSYIENGFVYRRVNKVKHHTLISEVYDLTVPGDNGFMVHGYGVSNCRVPYDICSCCEKRASSPKLYCEHLKENMLQYIPEFKKYAFAVNDKPKFFDISVVEKPADRIAHYLDYAFPTGEKSASVQGGIITGTQWAAFEGTNLPGDSSAWDPEQRQLLEKLASIEDYLSAAMYKSASMSDQKAAFAKNVIPAAFEGELTNSDIELLRKLRPGTMCRELAKRASILPFYSFMAYATGRTLEDTMSDPVTKTACCMLPKIFKTLMSSGCACDMGDLFDSCSDHSAQHDEANDDMVQNMMDMVEKRFSIKTEPVRNRVMTVTIVKGASYRPKDKPLVVLTDNFQKRALALAETYGMYKLSALLDIAKIHGSEIDEPQYLLAVGQNSEL